MSHAWIRYVAILFVMSAAVCAQPAPGYDAWLKRNYRFTTPPPPSAYKPADPTLTELRAIQDSVRNIMRRAKSDDDYESALAAASLAISNAQLIGAITEQQKAIQSAKPTTMEQSQLPPQPPSPLFLIALKDKTINTATAYWVDGAMLNYVTLQGVHIIVRLDLVDRALSRDLNRQRNVEFRLPE